MITDPEISHLWQFAHLKFHFGEKLALNAMLFSPTAIVPYRATPVEEVVGSDIRRESGKNLLALGCPIQQP
jgi:hypothetical protein